MTPDVMYRVSETFYHCVSSNRYLNSRRRTTYYATLLR